MRKYRQIFSFLIFWYVAISAAAQDQEAVFLSKSISLNVENEHLDRVLDRISKLAGINFSYDPTLLDTELPVTVSYVDKPLEFVLTDLLGREFTFQELGNQLIIRMREANQESASLLDGYRIVRGVIRDQEFNEAIPYASISILNKAFGTISNTEGRFELKIPPKYQHEDLVFSCLGYRRELIQLDSLKDEDLLMELQPVNIRLKEIKVRAIKPLWVLEQMVGHIGENYPDGSRLMTAFYREVLTQDDVYINVSEAVIQLLKASYSMPFRDDKIRFLKGRKSPDVETFQWVDFKMQGGPYYTTQLDVVKTMDSFLDEDYRSNYKYEAGSMIDYLGRPAYVIYFSPLGKNDFLTYSGKLFIDQETFALVHAEFSLSKSGIRIAREQLIRKKPKGFNVRALNLDYQVSYRQNEGLWYLNTAQSSVSFRVRSRSDQVNSVFHSVSDLLVTSHKPTRLRRFPKEEQLNASDIFTEMITDYDPDFWGNYNIIAPTDDLRKAIKSLTVVGKNNQPN
ncbi:carboxypeptidase-like regulatory domain-containing protein [Mangrovibacterium lignilyticum]|uniref:carboxypeptidase-like regulatory domain-containing protein n=1 Tax=Mangrovibacterium lignilyticum TaxID=2668052 RepID=UPI00196848EC|nr:carboxypeptidase-like regulatory domain-containing protein [Mangrovibacterium lignilyticum]